MICQNCQQNEATIHLYANVNGQRKQLDYCQSCYQKLKIKQIIPSKYGTRPFWLWEFRRFISFFLAKCNKVILMNNKHHPLNLVMVVMEVNPRGGAGAGQGLLGEYGINITEAARQGDIDPVVGRDQEIKRVIEILNRRTKTTPF